MRDLSPAFAARLDVGATTLCACWRVIRRDGVAQGFTDHDEDLTVGGQLYEARSGLDSTSFESPLGLAVGGAEVMGALRAASLQEDDLANGVWDGARVEIRRVDWSAPQHHVLLDVGVIGEVRRTDAGFVAELRSLAHVFDEERGRLFQSTCDADLGDARCRFAFIAVPFVGEYTLAAGSTALELRATLGALEDGWCDGGRIEFLTGANAGARVSIKTHRRDGASHRLALWTPLAAALAVGDVIRVYAGCDKTYATCRVKFANGENFRGFPHMPGNDHVMTYPGGGAVMDGGSLLT